MQQPEKRDEAIKRLTSDREVFSEGHQNAGEFYMRIGEFEVAAKLFEEGMRLDPDNENVYRLRVAEARAFTGDLAEALRQVEEILQDDPENDTARVLRGTLRIAAGDRETAEEVIAELETILPRMPQNPVVNYNLARAYLAIGQVDPAVVQLQEAIRKRSDYILPRLALGEIRLRRNEPAVALNEAREVLEVQPSNLGARLLRTNALIQLQQFDEARKELGILEANGSTQRLAQHLLAAIHAAEGSYVEAEKVLPGLRTSAPTDRRATAGLVELHVRQGHPERASELIDAEIAAAPDSRELRLLQARVSMTAGDYPRAIREYQEAIDARPDDAAVLLELGTAEYHTGDFASAEARYRRARELAPKDPSTSLQLALLLGELGEREQTRELLEEVLTLSPDNAVALNNLAYMLADSPESVDRALSLVQRAVNTAPNSPSILDTLGWVYLKKNLSDDAVRVYENLVAIEPSHPTWRYHLGMALYQKGDVREARNQLERAIEHGPSAGEAAQIRALLARLL